MLISDRNLLQIHNAIPGGRDAHAFDCGDKFIEAFREASREGNGQAASVEIAKDKHAKVVRWALDNVGLD